MRAQREDVHQLSEPEKSIGLRTEAGTVSDSEEA